MTVIGDILKFLVKLGLYDVILPFLLVFGISYGILERTKVLGKQNYDAMVSFVLGFIVVAFANLLNIVNLAVTYFVLTVVGLIMMLVLVKTIEKDWEPGDWPLGFGFAFLIIILVILFGSWIDLEWLKKVSEPLIPVVVLFALIALLAWIITYDSTKKVVKKKEKLTEKKKDEEQPQRSAERRLPHEMKGTPRLVKREEITPKGRQDIN